MNLKTLRTAAALASALAAAAAPGFAQADFTRYVAIGDSLTAGYQSAGLFQSAQVNSYPAVIARQAGFADFQQPLVSDPGIPAHLQLNSLVGPQIGPAAGHGVPLNLSLARPYNNLGVPGARVHDTVATINDGGLHDLILRNPAFQNTTALQQAFSLHPTFVTIWIGNNDVLGATTSGRVIEGVTLTPIASFQADFRTVVNTIAASGAKMAIANIADTSSIPFATTIPPFLVSNGAPVLGPNGVPIPFIGPRPDLPGGVGPLRLTDRVLLSAAPHLAAGDGRPPGVPGASGVPLTDGDVLSTEESAAIAARTAAFNAFIESEANRVGAAFIDARSTLATIASTGLNIGGIKFSSAFLTGGIFSYDGVHPTRFGYAFVADRFIAAINAKFGNHIPPPNFAAAMQGGGGGGSLVALDLSSLYLSPEANANLRIGLNTPSDEELSQLLPHKPRRGRGGHKH
ncbi:MAG: SGNH/GDSL hydrolase family protein [Acidobacteriota bacterium]